jgi:hypothetical protein
MCDDEGSKSEMGFSRVIIMRTDNYARRQPDFFVSFFIKPVMRSLTSIFGYGAPRIKLSVVVLLALNLYHSVLEIDRGRSRIESNQSNESTVLGYKRTSTPDYE